MRDSPGSVREPIDGDFFLEAFVALDGSCRADAGRGKGRVNLYGLRVRPFVAAEVSRPEKPSFRAPIKYSPSELPIQFSEWVKKELEKGLLVSAGAAVAAMKRALDPPPGRKVVRAWVTSLPEHQRAVQGETRTSGKRR
jgi:hypothetical protein